MTPRSSGLITGGLTAAWVFAAGVIAGGAAGGALVGLGLGLVLLLLATLLGPLSAVAVERILPAAPVRAGEPVTVVLSVHSRRWWPWLGLRLTDAGHELHLSLFSRRAATLTYRLPAVSRGIHPFAEIRLTAADPLGLVQRTGLLTVPGELVVWPASAPLPEVRALLPAACRNLAAPAAGGETAGVRPYGPGDPPQRIHWPATARTGRLLTRRSEPDRVESLHLVVNAPEEQLERALSQAAGLVEWGIRNHFRVGLQAGAEHLPPARGDAHLQRLMRALAACRAADVHPDPAPVPGQAEPSAPVPVGLTGPGARIIRLTGEVSP